MIIHYPLLILSALLLINPSISISTSTNPPPLSSYSPISIHIPSGVPGPTSRHTLLEFELADARQALLNIKKKLGPEALHKLVQSEIDEADIFWHEIINSSPDNETHSVSDVTVEALVSPHVLNTTIFLQWLQTFATNGKFPNRLEQGEPQHYFLNVNPPEVIESWGSIPVTHFTEAPSERKPFMVEIPPSEFPVQMFVTLNLRDGTLLADEIMALRDNDDGAGMRIRFVTYFPGGLGEKLVEGVRRHVAVELGNWMRFAWEDVVSGRFVPSLLGS
jgi:hypothetical protein